MEHTGIFELLPKTGSDRIFEESYDYDDYEDEEDEGIDFEYEDELFTIDDFVGHALAGCFNDFDGDAYLTKSFPNSSIPYVSDKESTSIDRIIDGKYINLDGKYTHVLWVSK